MGEFTGKTFTVPGKRRHRFTEIVPRYVDNESSLRVLDIGCGTGEQLIDLAESLPKASLNGVDISEPNIESAQQNSKRSPACGQLNFVCEDYMEFREGSFDVIMADSTLHLITVSTDLLFAKIAGDLRSDGILVFTMPYVCAYNSALIAVRRFFRLLRSSFTDKFILSMGKLLHRGRVSEETLRERVNYMYLLPQRYLSDALIGQLENSFGLDQVRQYPVAHDSPAQPKHRLIILRKKATDP